MEKDEKRFKTITTTLSPSPDPHPGAFPSHRHDPLLRAACDMGTLVFLPLCLLSLPVLPGLFRLSHGHPGCPSLTHTHLRVDHRMGGHIDLLNQSGMNQRLGSSWRVQHWAAEETESRAGTPAPASQQSGTTKGGPRVQGEGGWVGEWQSLMAAPYPSAQGCKQSVDRRAARHRACHHGPLDPADGLPCHHCGHQDREHLPEALPP